MRVNPIHERILLGDKLHIFTTSKQSAELCLHVLEDEAVLDCAINSQCISFLFSLLILVIDPFTTTSLPSTMSFLNIIPENDESFRSERNSMMVQGMHHLEGTSLELTVEENSLEEGSQLDHMKGESIILLISYYSLASPTISLSQHSSTYDEGIVVTRLPTTMSIDINSDIQEKQGPIFDSCHYVASHHYNSSDSSLLNEIPESLDKQDGSVSSEVIVIPKKTPKDTLSISPEVPESDRISLFFLFISSIFFSSFIRSLS